MLLWIQSTEDPKYLNGKKITESSRKQNFNFLCIGSSLHPIYVVLGIISNLKIIEIIREDVLRMYANSIPLYVRDWEKNNSHFLQLGKWPQCILHKIKLYWVNVWQKEIYDSCNLFIRCLYQPLKISWMNYDNYQLSGKKHRYSLEILWVLFHNETNFTINGVTWNVGVHSTCKS